MTDHRPIGFFDSGLGGLTCIPHLMNALPDERIIYFGDTARTPYGSKSVSTIRAFSIQIADFLIKNDVKMIVIACNTVTSTCLDILQNRFRDVPVLGIIRPGAEKAAEITAENDAAGIIGTKVTIKNKAYEEAIRIYNPKLRIFGLACPIFVPLIEEGIINSNIMDLAVRHYLDGFMSVNDIRTLVLGCTHYPLIRKNIERIYPNVRIVNPSEEIIASIKTTLQTRGLAAGSPSGKTRENVFYASDLSENFVNMSSRIFENTSYTAVFKNVDLENLS